MARPIILGIGGAHVDRRGQVTGSFVPGASNPGVMGEDVGGGTFNALRNAVQRDVEASMMSVRGGDQAGDSVARAIAQAGIRDLSATFLDRRTPSYTAILSSEGDVIAALADMALYDIAFPRQMRRASLRAAAIAASALFIDANLPVAAVRQVPGLAGGRPVFAIAISPAKAPRLVDILPELACLFLNTREAAALTGVDASAEPLQMVAALRDHGLKSAVLTRGALGVVAFDGQQALEAVPPQPRRIEDVTGAGDALAGATAAALLRGLALGPALREGMAASLLALETASPVADLSKATFADALALVPVARPLQQEQATGASHVA